MCVTKAWARHSMRCRCLPSPALSVSSGLLPANRLDGWMVVERKRVEGSRLAKSGTNWGESTAYRTAPQRLESGQ